MLRHCDTLKIKVTFSRFDQEAHVETLRNFENQNGIFQIWSASTCWDLAKLWKSKWHFPDLVKKHILRPCETLKLKLTCSWIRTCIEFRTLRNFWLVCNIWLGFLQTTLVHVSAGSAAPRSWSADSSSGSIVSNSGSTSWHPLVLPACAWAYWFAVRLYSLICWVLELAAHDCCDIESSQKQSGNFYVMKMSFIGSMQ